MKVQFIFRGKTYFAPSEDDGRAFLRFWNDNHGNIYPFKTTWDIRHVEIGPRWAPTRVDMGNKIEYTKA